MVKAVEEKPVLIEVEKEFRVLVFDERNLVLELWETGIKKNGKDMPDGYRFKGYYGGLKQIFMNLLVIYQGKPEKTVAGLESMLKRIEASEEKIATMIEEVAGQLEIRKMAVAMLCESTQKKA